MRPASSSLSMAKLLVWARRRFLIPAGLTAAVGLGTAGPVFHTPKAHAEVGLPEVAPAGRSFTPGKRRDEVVDVYEKVKDAVVNIHSERTVTAPADDPFNRSPVRPQQVNGMGTGIVLDPRGYILTNFHVVDEVHALRVRLHDGAGYTARVVATDKEADLALIKIDPARALPVMPFGTSSDLMVGEPVIAIGNAYGYEHTVTHGRVSFKGRDVSLNKDTGYKGLIQTSAPINPGNSGGPLLNVLGELVGVNVAIRAGAQNIGFALPIDFVVGRAAEMVGRRRGGPRHGLVVKNEVTREATESPARRVVIVEAVETGSVAAAAGFKPGDVVDRVEDVAVFTSIDLERALLGKETGAKVPVKVSRGGAPVALEVSFDPAVKVVATSTPADVAWKRLGVKVQPVGREAVAKANDQLHGGLLVTEVVVGSAAATAGIQKGDVLVGLHQWETLRPDDVAFVLNHKDFASFLPLKYFLAREGKLKDGWINGTP
ncbi:MAG: serine protease [Gemmataceae bacterium]|nr:serine protease [Gemmataceae bacterium]